ncbi:hypothetical protein MPH_10151 [Macrophomina phaseolina MS6]|uniref:Uncharacterized protein n=1 Tax=Macrophomina phaseolina (strain MS6) TaxID=1126212 RepID=K2RDS5_MACPH|nr:hypothetical protein MPH_10151 [Macrophomina phaseolina MS6]
MNSVRKKRNSDQPIIEFFQTYETSNNQRLSGKSVNTLSGLALKIPHEEKYLDDFESSYKKDPLSFWFNGHTNSSAGEGNLHVISYIFHDFDNTECLSLVRRRLILQLLSEQVDEEGKRLRETEVSRHGQTYRSWALQRVAEALSHEHPHFKKSRFKRAALAGSKWRRLRLGMCIGLANMGRVTTFERELDDLEFEAFNSYAATLSIYSSWLRLSSLEGLLKATYLDYIRGRTKLQPVQGPPSLRLKDYLMWQNYLTQALLCLHGLDLGHLRECSIETAFSVHRIAPRPHRYDNLA